MTANFGPDPARPTRPGALPPSGLYPVTGSMPSAPYAADDRATARPGSTPPPAATAPAAPTPAPGDARPALRRDRSNRLPPPADEERLLEQPTRRSRRSGSRTSVEATPASAPAASGSPRPAATAPPRVSRPIPNARRTPTPPSGLTGPIRMLLGPITGSLKLGKGRNEAAAPTQLKIDWPQCKAHGLCAELAPDLIRLDEWGYPWFEPRDFSGEDLATIRKAIQACPTLALRLVGGQKPERP